VAYAKPFGPNRQRLSFPSKRHLAIRTSITRLLSSRGPPAIRRFVIAIVVDPIDRMLGRRTWPHVLQEVVEREPSIADAYIPSSVSSILDVVLVETTGLHAVPGPVLWRCWLVSPCGMSVADVPGAVLEQVFLKTSTGRGSAANKIDSEDDTLGTTVTPDVPSSIRVARSLEC
jgi:hypothetical protein